MNGGIWPICSIAPVHQFANYQSFTPIRVQNNSHRDSQWKQYIQHLTTSYASVAYRKQIPPQWTVGTIGSVWQESTPSKETTGPAKRYENEQSEMRNGMREALAWARGF